LESYYSLFKLVYSCFIVTGTYACDVLPKQINVMMLRDNGLNMCILYVATEQSPIGSHCQCDDLRPRQELCQKHRVAQDNYTEDTLAPGCPSNNTGNTNTSN